MIRILLLLALTASAYGYGRIVGGKNADIVNFKHQVSLRMHRSHRCGGSIIAPNLILTAAHCVDGYVNVPSVFTVLGGTSFVRSGGVERGVQKIEKDSRYNPNTIDYDVAVLFLLTPFDFNSAIGAAPIVRRGQNIPAGLVAEVTGWGATREGGGVNNILQVVAVPHVDWDDCYEKYIGYGITKRMSCWGYDVGGKDACQGDSGGPLVINDGYGVATLAGVVSWGAGCARRNYPGIYADLTNGAIHDFVSKFL